MNLQALFCDEIGVVGKGAPKQGEMAIISSDFGGLLQ
jgi:hypothetical protein